MGGRDRPLGGDQGNTCVSCGLFLAPSSQDSVSPACCGAATAAVAAVVLSPSAANSARKAVMTAAHSLVNLLVVTVTSLSGWAICVLSS
ncbi:hypothetical protein B1H18_15160 [Streptomyces tsukubensis]|uniref:Uncharacterized protein n=1 Tax=Streptomyces tsukubensis TaxID=83656 RepID=A0A1V4A9U5_9ACTN|nr:hypothetical protein B1H18_15160 [Streptomyces tsukubensis]